MWALGFILGLVCAVALYKVLSFRATATAPVSMDVEEKFKEL